MRINLAAKRLLRGPLELRIPLNLLAKRIPRLTLDVPILQMLERSDKVSLNAGVACSKMDVRPIRKGPGLNGLVQGDGHWRLRHSARQQLPGRAVSHRPLQLNEVERRQRS